MTFYVLDENNNKVEAFDKEGVLAVLAQAIADGSLENIVADAAFVSKLKCCVNGITNNVAFVTQNKYNQLDAAGQLVENTYYFITDDSTCDEIDNVLQGLNDRINGIIETVNKLPYETLVASNITIQGGTEIATVIVDNLKQGWYVINLECAGNCKTIKVYVGDSTLARTYAEIVYCGYDIHAAGAGEDYTKGILQTVAEISCYSNKIELLPKRFSTKTGWGIESNVLTVESVYRIGL